ncbi:MAG: YajQ family cyclic di-GMP-binding protein [Bacteroidetes bacterium]|nr:YajQ family cyclic di-GMP-binding protein [Bacteroidota bacterium]MBS1629789.1 YajQ family cyclic di-GMP-binding protein [Bacteroidota bacterium]
MPSFDISSKVDLQTLDNAINVVKKEVDNRYDFKGSHVQVELNKKELSLSLETDSDMQMRQLEDILLTKSMRQGIEANAFDLSGELAASGKHIRKTVKVKNGIDRDTAKKIVKLIKDSKLKVEAAIMDDIIRVSSKKIDDLQAVIQLCKSGMLEIPLQFVNMKS